MPALRRLSYYLRRALYGHILNPLWAPYSQRRARRRAVYFRLIEDYVADIPVIDPPVFLPSCRQTPRIFSIWLQGADNAPALVRTCWNSIRHYSGLELVILDHESLRQWIDLPAHIMQIWESGKMRPAHFADICRVELLWKYGGIWMDATDYMTHPLPDFVLQQPFFMYISGDDERGSYPYVQNCFIRSEAHNPLLGAWRQCIHEYWKRETTALDYFIHQQLFYHVIRHSRTAKALFDQMPHIHHDCTHVIWYGGYIDAEYDPAHFQALTRDGAFQKTTYRTYSTTSPVPGSNADHIINSFPSASS